MTIYYEWANEGQTSIKYTDDSTTPDTVKFIPVATGNRDYQEYLTWEAVSGNDITAYSHPGYDTIANARSARIADARSAIEAWVKENYLYEFRRAALNTGYTLPTAAQTAIDAAYTLFDNFSAAINSEVDIEDVRTATIDYAGDTYNIPT